MNEAVKTSLVLVLCLMTRLASGEEVVRTINWPDLVAEAALPSAAVVVDQAGGAEPFLRVVHRGGTGETFHLVTITAPAIRTARYGVRGLVRYENVVAGSYLEMWNQLPEGAFFSRSLDESGPMGRLDGSSEWRPFLLPFFNREDGPPPNALVLNLVMAGNGTVEIGPIQLAQFDADDALSAGPAGGGGATGRLASWAASSGRRWGFWEPRSAGWSPPAAHRGSFSDR